MPNLKLMGPILHPSFVEVCLVVFVWSCWQTDRPPTRHGRQHDLLGGRDEMKTNIGSLGDATFALVVKKQNAHLTLKHETQGRLLSAKSNI